MGLGYYQGKPGGLALCYNVSQRLTTIVPISLKNVILDYYYMKKGLGYHLKMRINFYFGIGTDIGIGGGGKKAKDGDLGITADLRFPIGVVGRVSGMPLDIFLELAPTLKFFNGSDIEVDQAKIKWEKVGLGVRYYF